MAEKKETKETPVRYRNVSGVEQVFHYKGKSIHVLAQDTVKFVPSYGDAFRTLLEPVPSKPVEKAAE